MCFDAALRAWYFLVFNVWGRTCNPWYRPYTRIYTQLSKYLYACRNSWKSHCTMRTSVNLGGDAFLLMTVLLNRFWAYRDEVWLEIRPFDANNRPCFAKIYSGNSIRARWDLSTTRLQMFTFKRWTPPNFRSEIREKEVKPRSVANVNFVRGHYTYIYIYTFYSRVFIQGL